MINNKLYNEESEKAVVGSMIVDKQAVKLYIEKDLDIEVFHNVDNQGLTTLIVDLYKQYGSVDVPMLWDKVLASNYHGLINKGFENLFDYVGNAIALSDFNNYVKNIEDKYKLRKLVNAGNEIVKKAVESDGDIDLTIFQSEQIIKDIAKYSQSNGMIEIKEVVKESVNKLNKAIENKGRITGLKTGFDEFDKITGGLHGGELIILGARPSVGKTAFALNLLTNASRLNKGGLARCAMFSLEMTPVSLVDRVLSSMSGVEGIKIRDGRVNQKEYNDLSMAYSNMEALNIHISESTSMTMADVYKESRLLYQNGGIDLIVVDYLQLIMGNGRNGNRQNEISEISRQLKNLSLELNVPVIALSQLSRKVEDRDDKSPRLSDLRESGSIEQDADIVMFLHRDDYGNTDEEVIQSSTSHTELSIKKHRNGSLAEIDLIFDKRIGKFFQTRKE